MPGGCSKWQPRREMANVLSKMLVDRIASDCNSASGSLVLPFD